MIIFCSRRQKIIKHIKKYHSDKIIDIIGKDDFPGWYTFKEKRLFAKFLSSHKDFNDLELKQLISSYNKLQIGNSNLYSMITVLLLFLSVIFCIGYVVF